LPNPSRPDAKRAFTLIEVLVVVSILAMLAAAGMLQLTRARIITHEELALVSMRQISRACHFFFLANQRFPTSLTELSTAAPPYIPVELAGDGFTVDQRGYRFTYANPSSASFSLNADPITAGVTGSRYFYVDQALVIHVDQTGPADANDPVIP
jgi:prepilin-type N-terminal cleavage/methylation domain-containing protein